MSQAPLTARRGIHALALLWSAEGGQGTVYLAKVKDTSEFVALKKLEHARMSRRVGSSAKAPHLLPTTPRDAAACRCIAPACRRKLSMHLVFLLPLFVPMRPRLGCACSLAAVWLSNRLSKRAPDGIMQPTPRHAAVLQNCPPFTLMCRHFVNFARKWLRWRL